MIGDEKCNKVNFFKTCGLYDGGDCLCPKTDLVGNGQCNEDLKDNFKCNYDDGDCCEQSLIGDGYCNGLKNFSYCRYLYNIMDFLMLIYFRWR